jgi:hypothetical protein|nr:MULTISPECIES: DUF4189 domain-containing protein [unclassified Dyella]
MIPYGTAQDQSVCGPDPNAQQQPQQPSQPPVRWASRWGAVVSDQGAFGIVSDMPDKESAISSAMQECHNRGGANCTVNNVYANACVAVMANGQIIWTENAQTSDDASRLGMKNCSSKGSAKCWVYYSGCSLARRIQ